MLAQVREKKAAGCLGRVSQTVVGLSVFGRDLNTANRTVSASSEKSRSGHGLKKKAFHSERKYGFRYRVV